MTVSDRGERDDLETEPLQPERSLGELLSQLLGDVVDLIRQEFELAKVEARDELRRASKAATLFAGAAVGGWMALLFLSLALAWLLDQAMNTALAFGLVGVAWALAAVVLVGSAKRKMKEVKAMPQTTETLKEDLEWTRTRKN